MIRVLPVVAAFAASAMSIGCAQLAGIDETNNSAKANTVALTRLSIGTTVKTAPLDLDGLSATYLVSGASGLTHVAAGLGAKPGTWSARMPSAAPVEFTLPDTPTPVPRLYEFASSAISVADIALEHPDPMPVPDAAMMTVTVPLDAAPGMLDTFETFSVGAWASRQVQAAELPAAGGTTLSVAYPYSQSSKPGTPATPYSSSTKVVDSPTLDRLTTQDAFFVLRYTIVGLSGVAEATPFDQTGTDNIMFPAMQPLVADQSFTATTNSMDYTMRYAAAMPSFSMLNMNWSISAAPGFAVATPGLTLVFNTATTDPGVTTMYANPFVARGWATLFEFNTHEDRPYMSAAGNTLTLSARMSQSLAPTSAPAVLDLPAGLPTTISVNGNALAADDQLVATPTAPVTVTFRTDDDAHCTLFDLNVYELVPPAAPGPLTRVPVVFATSDHASFVLPPETFKTGSSYTMTAVCTFGFYPNLARGDFVTTALPVAGASLDSPVFTVMP